MVEPVLIKNTKKESVDGRDADLQEANARMLADLRLKENSANNPLWICKVEDPTVKAKCRYFAAIKLNQDSPTFVDIVGVEIDQKKQNAYQSFNDVENYVNEGTARVVSIKFPWTRVINIENRTYKRKK